MITNTIPNS